MLADWQNFFTNLKNSLAYIIVIFVQFKRKGNFQQMVANFSIEILIELF